jgi:hypothetical protein
MNKLKSLYRFISPKFQSVFLDYKVVPKPRFGQGQQAHGQLYDIIDSNRAIYEELLRLIAGFSDVFINIKQASKETNEDEPSWNNGFFPGLDIVGLYGMLAIYKPALFLEIGSGNSTKVARKYCKDFNAETRIVSIDPFPRASIDHLADEIIREPLENLRNLDLIADRLNPGDVLFIDNSHRSFANSDVTVCFLELIPRLKKGVIVHIHDIYLPEDYPQFMCDRFYNEQYLLAAFLLANPSKYRTILPNYFISQDPNLSTILKPLWEHPALKGVEQHGGSYWFEINE